MQAIMNIIHVLHERVMRLLAATILR
eukprot:SAG22_NODE_19396_length_275_cov_0.852273_1_plen_25_part_10